MKKLTALIATASLLASPMMGEDQNLKDEGWVDLFDGKSIESFQKHGGEATYAVVDGAIVGTNGPGPNTFLCTPKSYSNFILEFETKVDPALNSGVQIRSKVKDQGKIKRVYGPQVEIEESPGESGYIYGEAIEGGWRTKNPQKHEKLRNGEWNKYKIVAEGPRIQTFINGEPVADLTDEEIYKTHPEGFIGLQVHQINKPAGTVRVSWRNLRIKELK